MMDVPSHCKQHVEVGLIAGEKNILVTYRISSVTIWDYGFDCNPILLIDVYESAFLYTTDI